MAEKKRRVLKVDTSAEPEKVKFVVKAGQSFGIQRFREGYEIELTVAEALPFADKLEPVDRSTVLPNVATEEELAEVTPAKPVLRAPTPVAHEPKSAAEKSK